MEHRKHDIISTLLKILSTVLVISVVSTFLIYLLLNGTAVWKNFKYQVFLITPFASAELREGDILEIEERVSEERVSEERDSGERDSEQDQVTGEQVNPILVIPKIEVDVPVITPRSNSKASILASLEDGVGLYPGSVRPGEDGRSIVLGHSSLASWYGGDYATIFTLLPNLEVGDKIFVLKDGKRLEYEVFESQIMDPDDANQFINKPTNGHELVLITCYPIGTSSQRNVVSARLVN